MYGWTEVHSELLFIVALVVIFSKTLNKADKCVSHSAQQISSQNRCLFCCWIVLEVQVHVLQDVVHSAEQKDVCFLVEIQF